MATNEYCQFVTFLIPKYIKGQCANAERTLVDEHCAGCQECRLKLTRAIAAAKTRPVKEVLFLSRPKNLKKPQRLGGNEKEQGKKGNPPSVSGGDFAIDWKDKVLESRMREITGIHSRDIMCSDVKTIKKLKLSRGSYNPIRNISALSNLTNLEELNLSCNMISDISALSNLKKLRGLELNFNEIRDIEALSNLTKLSWLELSWNQITDYSPIEQLKIARVFK